MKRCGRRWRTAPMIFSMLRTVDLCVTNEWSEDGPENVHNEGDSAA